MRSSCSPATWGTLAALAVMGASVEAATIPGTSLTPTVWLKADAPSGVNPSGGSNGTPANNTQLGAWLDSSGNGRHATQGITAQQPRFISNVVNGRPVVRFDGSNAASQGDFMTIGGGPLANTDLSKLTLFIVSNDNRLVGDVNNKAVLSTRDNRGNGWVETYEPGSAQHRYVHIGLGTGATDKIDDPLGVDRFHLLEVRRDGMRVEYGHDGELQVSAVLDDFKPTTLTGTHIGNNNNDLNRFFRGDIAEIIAFDNTALGNAQRDQVEQYLLTKYGIPAAAPVPEPTSIAALGLIGAASLGRRRRAR